ARCASSGKVSSITQRAASTLARVSTWGVPGGKKMRSPAPMVPRTPPTSYSIVPHWTWFSSQTECWWIGILVEIAELNHTSTGAAAASRRALDSRSLGVHALSSPRSEEVETAVGARPTECRDKGDPEASRSSRPTRAHGIDPPARAWQPRLYLHPEALSWTRVSLGNGVSER